MKAEQTRQCERLRRLIELRGLRYADVGEQIGVSHMTVRRWAAGEKYPHTGAVRQNFERFLKRHDGKA